MILSQVDSIKTNLIENSVEIKVDSLCSSCGFTISNVKFYCYDDDTSITIRGIVETKLVSYLMTWVAGSPEVYVEGTKLIVDKSCTVIISSFDDDGCPVTDRSVLSSPGSMQFGVGIGVGIGCLVLLAVIIALVIVYMKRRKLKRMKIE